jgi:hypothetical protein
MAQAFITGLKIDPTDTLNVTVSVQQTDPLSFTNLTFQMPYDAAFQAMTRQQQRNTIIQAFKATFPNGGPTQAPLDASQFSGSFLA